MNLRHWMGSCLMVSILIGELFGQQLSNKSLSLEIGGIGGLGSMSIEWPLRKIARVTPELRVGLSFTPIDRNNGIGLIIPVMLQGKLGKDPHYMEVGLGQALTLTTKGSAFVRMPMMLGHRLQPKTRRYFVGLAYTPLVSWLLDIQWQHWAGIRIGYIWKKD